MKSKKAREIIDTCRFEHPNYGMVILDIEAETAIEAAEKEIEGNYLCSVWSEQYPSPKEQLDYELTEEEKKWRRLELHKLHTEYDFLKALWQVLSEDQPSLNCYMAMFIKKFISKLRQTELSREDAFLIEDILRNQ